MSASSRRNSSSKSPSQRGYALLSTLILVTFLALSAGCVALMSTSSRRTSIHRVLNAQALHLASGVFNDAAKRIVSDPALTGILPTSLGAGMVWADVTVDPTSSTQRILTAVGTATNFRYTGRRTIRGTMDLLGIPPVFFNALASKNDLTLSGDLRVDSYPLEHVGNVHSNTITTHNGGGSGYVDGRSSATDQIILSGSPTITGGAESGVAPMVFPGISATFKAQAVAAGITSGNVIVSDGSLVQGKITGRLQIDDPSGCRISGVVWVEGDVRIRGPITGTGTIVSDGRVEIDTRTYDPLTDPSSLAIISTSDGNNSIRLNGSNAFKGLLYAPNGEINIQGNARLYGIAVASMLTFGGNPYITRWTNFDVDVPNLPRIPVLKGYQEL